MGHVELHDITDGKPTLSKQECALEWIRVLDAVASQVQDVRRCVTQKFSQLVGIQGQRRRVDDRCLRRLKALADQPDFLSDFRQLRHPWSRRLADNQASDASAWERLPVLSGS
jgi:hypothetical protein